MKLPKYTIKVKPMMESRQWMLLEDIRYKGFFVPKGFITDLASIPVYMRWLFPHGGAKAYGAVHHDYLYRLGNVDRDVADDLFLELMLANGVSKLSAKTMYKAVRSFGYFSFKGADKGSIKNKAIEPLGTGD